MTGCVAFVGATDGGRSQLAAALTERELARQGRDDVTVVHAGVDPAPHVHGAVVTVLRAVGLDVADRTPRPASAATLTDCDLLVRVGASTLPSDVDATVREWDLDDPDGRSLADVRSIRDDAAERARALVRDLAGG